MTNSTSLGASSSESLIEAYRVPDSQRLAILPRYFGRHMMIAEGLVYHFMTVLCDEYKGGYWDFYELSNGSFYMTPKGQRTTFRVRSHNGFDEEVGKDAAGIIACLYAFNELQFRVQQSDSLYRVYQRLWHFAKEHDERGAIQQAID